MVLAQSRRGPPTISTVSPQQSYAFVSLFSLMASSHVNPVYLAQYRVLLRDKYKKAVWSIIQTPVSR